MTGSEINPTRRALLNSAAATAVAAVAMPGWAQAQATAPGGRLAQTFDTMVAAQLRLNPETATQLGLDKGANADLRAQLTDMSDAGRAAQRAQTGRDIAALEAIDPNGLSPTSGSTARWCSTPGARRRRCSGSILARRPTAPPLTSSAS